MNGITGRGRKAVRLALKAGLTILLGGGVVISATSQPPPQVGTATSSQHSFLSFSGGKTQAQTPASALKYMQAIDPGGKKLTFEQWLLNAGFIQKATDWSPNGQQTYTHQHNPPQAGDYGPGKINAFAHIIILNSADLGFIRNQYIRCNPDCLTPNAKVFTYLENYKPTQFAKLITSGPNAGAGDPNYATTNTREAVTIALERRATDPRQNGRIADVAFEWAPAANGTNPGHLFGTTYAYVVDAHEPQPFSSNPTATPQDCAGNQVVTIPRDTTIEEYYTWAPDDGANPPDAPGTKLGLGNNQGVFDCVFNTRPSPTLSNPDVDRIGFLNPRPDVTVLTNDVFAPELDQLGTKMMPGVCLICHGGNIPSTVGTSSTPWGTTGEIQEFKFLPADAVNSVFGCDDTAAASPNDACRAEHFSPPAGNPLPTLTHPLVNDGTAATTASNMTRSAQEIELKKYNQAVLITHGAYPPKTGTFDSNGVITGGNWTFPQETDDQGVKRPSAGIELILGWYADRNNLADVSMSGVAIHNTFHCVSDPKTGQTPDCNELILQNDGFIPVGWRGTSTGPAQPVGQHVTPQDLYLNVVAHDCRSCHMTRELSLDFGTERQFSSNQGNIQDYTFQPECDAKLGQINPDNIVMPLAKLTWERLWNGIDPLTNIANDGGASTSPTDTTSPINKLKAYFGQTPTSYCAHQN
jgi:hypothetical protein